MSASLNIATRALTTNLAALQVVGNNIANVNTEGYSRQNVALKTSGYQERSNGFFGQGVEIATVTRNHDAYLTREANAAKSVASADGMRLSKLKQLEDLFPTGPTGLGASMNSMLNAWNDVASAPSNLTARTVVLARGDEFSARVRSTAAGVYTHLRAHESTEHRVCRLLLEKKKEDTSYSRTGVYNTVQRLQTIIEHSKVGEIDHNYYC